VSSHEERTDKEEPMTEYAANLVEKMHDIRSFARQHIKVASVRMKARYDHLVNSAGFQEGDRVWLYHPTWKKGKITEVVEELGRAVHHHPYQRGDLSDSTARPGEDDGSPSEPTGTILRAYSGRVALSKRQCYIHIEFNSRR
jgi:hypothetical protein